MSENRDTTRAYLDFFRRKHLRKIIGTVILIGATALSLNLVLEQSEGEVKEERRISPLCLIAIGNMKINIKNLGILKQAELTLGDLTIICGENNTGKTYATYTLFGFLFTWRRVLEVEIKAQKMNQLLQEGVINLEIKDYVKKIQQILDQGCRRYIQELPKIFATSKERWQDTEFQISLDVEDLNLNPKHESTMRTAGSEILSVIKDQNSTKLTVTLLSEDAATKIPTVILHRIISDLIKNIIFAPILPRPFIASAERTGAAIFRKELNFARNRLPFRRNRSIRKTN